MKFNLRKIIRAVAKVGPSVLKLVGIKKGTVVADLVEVDQKLDEHLPPPK